MKCQGCHKKCTNGILVNLPVRYHKSCFNRKTKSVKKIALKKLRESPYDGIEVV